MTFDVCRRWPRLAIGLMAFLPLLANGAEQLFSEGVRSTPWLSPADEQKKFHLPPGFEIQLVASEPDLIKPINMAFDARGRLWVTVTREYPFPAPLDKPARDGIRILEDFDADGKAHKVTTFVEELNIPTGIYPFHGGCIAWSIPNIWFFPDANGDDKADKREVLYGPLGWERDTHGMNSSFRRGFDGWLYATHGYNNNSTVRGKDGSEIKMNSGNTYRIRLDGSRVEQHTFGQVNPFGLCFDPLGNLYSADCHSAPIYQLLRGGYYPSFGKPDDGLGFAPVMMEHAHGSTAICGISYYSDSLWPEEYRDNIFIGNVMTSRVNRDRLTEIGSTKIANEMPDFVRTDDPWFRPVDIQLGPDGALYIADFYNRIIGHYEVPLTHPGRDRTSGRIWRIVYRGADGQLKLHPRRPDLTRASAAELVEALRDPNQTYRMLATDQLVDRIGKGAIPALQQALSKANASQKVHSIWALHRLGALDEKTLLAAAHDSERDVRIHAMRIMQETANLNPAMRKAAFEALKDSDAYVKRCAAEVLSLHPASENIRPLLDLRPTVVTNDTHLLYVARKALRDQLLSPDAFRSLEGMQLTADQQNFIADVAVAVRSEAAGAWLVNYIEQHADSASHQELISQLRHCARYAPESALDKLAAIIRPRVADDLDLQLELFKSVQEGARQRGKPLTAGCKAWGENLAAKLLESADSAQIDWSNTPLPEMSDTKNPWFVQKRTSADGDKNSLFLCSLPPGGEHLTGVLRSKQFQVPEHLRFYLAGHDGHPSKARQRKNVVRLREVRSQQVLAEAYAPRNDTAQPVNWNLGAYAGQSAVLEVTDADNGEAFAWLAIGRFDPPVVKVPSVDPNKIAQRQKAAAELAASLRIQKLRQPLAALLWQPSTDLEARGAIAQAIASFGANEQLSALAGIVGDPGIPEALREHAARAIAGKAQEAPAVIGEALRIAPHRVQLKLAEALAGSASGAAYLLRAAADRQISPALLLDRATKDKLLTAKIPNAKTEIEKLTENISPPNETIQKLIDQRRKKFDPAKAKAIAGAAVFQQNCAVCHQLDGKGGLVGPQLDGIGNRGLERLCEDVLDPNRNVDPAFRTTLVVRKDGDVASGLFRREEGETIVLAESTGKEISIPKKEVVERRQSDTSLMPENFGEIIPDDQFNDLMAFLLSKSSAKAN